MFAYVTLGTNDVGRARAFYDPVMATLGFACHDEYEDEVGYGPVPPPASGRKSLLWITKPYLKYPATWGNGTGVVFSAPTRAAVEAFYKAAIANGGSDDGAPGLRPHHDKFYACYVRDPDGNKLSALCES